MLREVVQVLKGKAPQRIADASEVALDVVAGAGDMVFDRGQIPTCVRGPAVPSDCTHRAAQPIHLGAGRRVVMLWVACMRLLAGMGATGVVVGVVSVGLPGRRGELVDVEWAERRIGNFVRDAVDDALLGSVGVQGANDAAERVVEHLDLAPKHGVGSRAIGPAGVEEGLVFLDDAAFVVVALPAADGDVGLAPVVVGRALEGGARRGVVLVEGQHAAAESRVAEAHSFALSAGLQQAAKTVGVLARFDGLAGVVGVGVVADAADRSDVDRLWRGRRGGKARIVEGAQGIFHSHTGIAVVTFIGAWFAAREDRRDKATGRVPQLAQVLVRVGDRGRLQGAKVIAGLGGQASRSGNALWKQAESVVFECDERGVA